MKSIPESDVIFGPYDEKDLFYIEKSELYKSLREGLKTVEFILRASATEQGIVFVEAKSNGSNPENKDTSEEKRKKFEKFYTDVPDKFVDSLGIYTAAILKRYSDASEVGENLALADLKDVKLTFALVITNPATQIEWLAPMKAELEERLRRWMKIWDIDVVVLNQDLAKRWGLIQDSAD